MLYLTLNIWYPLEILESWWKNHIVDILNIIEINTICMNEYMMYTIMLCTITIIINCKLTFVQSSIKILFIFHIVIRENLWQGPEIVFLRVLNLADTTSYKLIIVCPKIFWRRVFMENSILWPLKIVSCFYLDIHSELYNLLWMPVLNIKVW